MPDWLIGLGSALAMLFMMGALLFDPFSVEIPDDIPGSEET